MIRHLDAGLAFVTLARNQKIFPRVGKILARIYHNFVRFSAPMNTPQPVTLPTNIAHISAPPTENSTLATDYQIPILGAPTVVGYARVSTDLQREKESIRTQIECIEAECRARGWRLGEVYCDDGVSGTLPLEARPAGARLLRDALAGQFKLLVVYKSDRIGRDVLVNEMAARALHDELGVGVHGVAESIELDTPIGRAMFTFQSAIGKLERENTLRRSRDATHRLAREGTWLGGIVPYGYRVEGVDRAARLVLSTEVDSRSGLREVEVMRKIYGWAGDEGVSCIEIAKRLNALNVPTCYTRDGRKIPPSASLAGEGNADEQGSLADISGTSVDGSDTTNAENSASAKADTPRGKRRVATRGVWRAGRVRNMLVETTYKGIHIWGKRRSRKAAGTANQSEPVLIERAVPAIVDADLWARAQETLRRNRLCRPDIVKRKYLLRGLMKCAHCGLTYIGTVSEGRKLERVPESERAGLEVRGGLVLRKYYLCNGKNGSHQSYGKLDKRCTSGHIRALELEELVWADIAGFLREPGEVLNRLRAELHSRGADPAKAKVELDRLEKLVAAHDEQRATLYRLFRRGAMTEGDLEAQIAEISAEAGALTDERERLQAEWERARNSQGALESAEQLLDRLRLKLNATDEAVISWETRRRIVEELVAGIEVESLFDAGAPRGKQRTASVRITNRFEAPDANRAARGKRNNGTATSAKAVAANVEDVSASALSLRTTHQMHSAPSAATDKATLPTPTASFGEKATL